jgi:hypothetical protein
MNILLLSTQAGFLILTVVFAILLFRQLKIGIEKTSWNSEKKKSVTNRIVIGFVLWMVIVSAWSASGKMSDFSLFPFNFAPILIIPMVTVVAFLFSKGLGEVLENIAAENLIRLQVFRLFVEILLWMLFIQSLIPVQMTFEGRNFDILAGVSAPIISLLVSQKKLSNTVAIIWNVLCLGLLVNIVSIALMSTPTPIRVFMNEPSSSIVAQFPISWLPGFLVPLAYTLHFFSLKQLLAERRKVALAKV